MKTLYLMYSRIKQYFLKNRLMFVLFMIGGIINSIMLIYCYGNILSIVLTRDSQDVRYREYHASFRDNAPSEESVNALLSYADGKGVVAVMGRLPKEEAVPGGNFATMLMPYHSEHDKYLVEGTANFTAPNQVLAPVTAYLKPGETVNLQGRTLEVIGVVEQVYHCPNFIVSPDTFFEMGGLNLVGGIFFIADETQNFIFGTDPHEQVFRQLFEDTQSSKDYPSTSIRRIILDTLMALPKVLITYIIAALCYIFMLRYLIDSTMNETVVSMIVGAPKPTLIGSIFWESTVLSLGANTLGILVHILLYQPVFNQLNLHEHVVYKPVDYLNILLLMFVTGFVVVIPVVMKYLRLPPMVARRAQK